MVLLECNSKQNGSRPMAARRFCTTSNAAIFSATNSTRFPWKRALEIILVIVCDFPVPGGPCRTKLLPDAASLIAANCDESALIGRAISSDGNSSTVSASLVIFSFNLPDTRLSISGCSDIDSRLVRMSFHITKRLKSKMLIIDSSITSHLSCSITALRTAARIYLMSSPLSF